MKLFKGDMGYFNVWNSKIMYRLCTSTGRWRELLKKTQESDGPITKAYLQDVRVGFGESARTIAEDVENCLVQWFRKAMKHRRDQLCGGPDEAGNNMEMWRRLHMEFEGGS